VGIVPYDSSRRSDLAALTVRVWGGEPDEGELEWFHERNPVRPSSVLLGEEDGAVVASVALSFVRMTIAGADVEVGIAVRLATDPAAQGRGWFTRLQQANEERARELGVGLLLVVPNAASEPILAARLGWTRLPSIRLWARPRLLPARQAACTVERFVDTAPSGREGEIVRDDAWLNWRFAACPRPYTLLEGDGVAVIGRRGKAGMLALSDGGLLRAATAAAAGPAVVAAPPPGERGRYARAGYVPTNRRLRVLGKALDPGVNLPAAVHLQLGDLDFV